MYKLVAVTVSLFASATLFAVTTDAAHAEEAAPSITISYADLNLATPEGQNRLDRRIERAARALCAMDMPTTGTHVLSNQSRECYRLAIRTSRQQVATALQNNKNGG